MAPQSCPCACNSHGFQLAPGVLGSCALDDIRWSWRHKQKSLPSLPMTGSVVPGSHYPQDSFTRLRRLEPIAPARSTKKASDSLTPTVLVLTVQGDVPTLRHA